MTANMREHRRIPLGVFRGLRFGVVLHPHFGLDVYLEGAATRQAGMAEHKGPRAVLNAIDRLANTYGSECDRLRQELTIAESQLRDYQARIGMSFDHEGYLSELADLREQLKTGLSTTISESEAESRPKVSELAQQIKALKAAHSIELTPERIGKNRSSAEEPVTARILRHKHVK